MTTKLEKLQSAKNKEEIGWEKTGAKPKVFLTLTLFSLIMMMMMMMMESHIGDDARVSYDR